VEIELEDLQAGNVMKWDALAVMLKDCQNNIRIVI